MVKDSRKHASTGGWGFAKFNDGKPADEAVHNTCFPATGPSKLATLSSPVTHLKTENQIINMARRPWWNLFPRQTLGAVGNLFLCATNCSSELLSRERSHSGHDGRTNQTIRRQRRGQNTS